ncbi:sugar ABC transporter ATP-binding protein [Streptomyces sp. F63]|uniref:sugar ABC transporter ATP-binding protein n=1 Tax=Streptomyces sp. F63 TaxID=2824887 RepID=UPI001B367C7A|nr:sugar ABC transporter ATP-binding protein [Streptomyces sp. F63]MBQ0987097.1 sugar ABC transporter ATP-binding protein [Streptomyces sp. F63]
MTGITKSFPGVRALDGVDLDVLPGEVHCLLGQNGAGKSTLIKVLSGAHRPDAGEIRWRGERVHLTSPTAAMDLGIATIYQELDLVDGLSVTENVHLGHEPATAGFVRSRAARAATAGLLARLGHPEIAPGTLVRDLSAAGRQIVSMARALSHDVRLIVMDEPSAVLDPDEVDNLFRIVGDLTAAGVAVVYISHRLEEIRRIGDRVTVLKDGRAAARGLPARTTPTREVVALMTGRDVEYAFPERSAPPEPAGTATAPQEPPPAAPAPVLAVEGLARKGEFEPVDLELRPGEIVGLAGLVGSGRSEILETVFGARRPDAGRVLAGGRPLPPGSVRAAVRAGIGLAPEERKTQGLLMLESVVRNVSVSSLARFARGGWLDRARERAAAHRSTRELSLRPDDPSVPVRTLSGGNQQKVVLARWLLRGCKVLLLDEPTRGVDVGARAELYALIRRLADDGVAVLLVSSEVPEVLGLADRVLVLREGRVVHTAPAGELDEHRVLDLVMEGSPSR